MGTLLSAKNGMKLDTQFTGGVILKYTYAQEADLKLSKPEWKMNSGRPVSVQTSEDPLTGEKKAGADSGWQPGNPAKGTSSGNRFLNSLGGNFCIIRDICRRSPISGLKHSKIR